MEKDRVHMDPKADLNLYGSSCNGFAIANSDMDICFR